jgi:hypothetical protein
MEQNGTKDRIHLSKETAGLVVEAGKSKWIVPREDKIVAKGKGKLILFCTNSFKFVNLTSLRSNNALRHAGDLLANTCRRRRTVRLGRLWN